MIITIDGPVASGKSTIAMRLAEKLGYICIHSGAMYRMITLLSIRRGIAPTDVPGLMKLAQACRIDFAHGGKLALLNGKDVSDAVHAPEIDMAVSEYACIAELRREMLNQLRRIGESDNLIVVGRSIGNTVFPNADHKFYVTASLKERAKRRLAQLRSQGINDTLEQVEGDIRRRDDSDFSRRYDPLRMAPEAVMVNTTNITIDQSINFILCYLDRGKAMKIIHFATKNAGKIKAVQSVLSKYGVQVIQENLELPEPRTDDLQVIAAQKVLAAYQSIRKPVISQDAGLYIHSLNGFPKTYVTFTLETIGLEGILRLLEGKPRECEFRNCLAYYDGKLQQPKIFESQVEGSLADSLKGERKDYFWSDLFLLFIPEERCKTFGEMTYDEYYQWRDEKYRTSFADQFGRWFTQHK